MANTELQLPSSKEQAEREPRGHSHPQRADLLGLGRKENSRHHWSPTLGTRESTVLGAHHSGISSATACWGLSNAPGFAIHREASNLGMGRVTG